MKPSRKARLAAVLPVLLVSALLYFSVSHIQGQPADPAEQARGGCPDRVTPVGLVAAPAVDPDLAAVGEELFDDPRLSATGDVSCASCHDKARAFTDGLPVAEGIAVGRRNTPTIVNLAFSRNFTWDGHADTLEGAIRGALVNPAEMGLTEEALVASLDADLAVLRARFPDAEIDLDFVAAALAEHVRTLAAGDSAVDRFLYCGDDTALTAQERRGWEVFSRGANCVECHTVQHDSVGLGGGLALFTDGRFHNIGAGRSQDAGRAEVTGSAADTGAFKTPTLRNVSRTGPYMHDGSLATLEEVVDFYDDGGGNVPGRDRLVIPLSLTQAEKDDLVAFLRSLDSPE